MLKNLNDLIGLKVKHRFRETCNYYTGTIAEVFNNGAKCMPHFHVLNLNGQLVKYTSPIDWALCDNGTPMSQVFNFYKE